MTRAYVYWSTNYSSVSGSPLVFTSNCPAASTISWSQLSNPYHGIAQAHLHLIQSPISSFDRCFSLNHIPCFYRILGIVLFFIIWWIIWLYHKSYYVLINTYFTWTYIEWKPMTSSWFQLSCFSFVSWSILSLWSSHIFLHRFLFLPQPPDSITQVTKYLKKIYSVQS